MNIFKFINSHLSVSIADGNINHHLDAEIIEPGDVLIKDCTLLKESRKLKGEN